MTASFCNDDAFDRVVSRLATGRTTAKGIRTRCPAHDDNEPSLDVDRGRDGTVLLSCRSNHCSAQDVVSAIGLTMSDLFPSGHGSQPRSATFGHKKEKKRHATIEDAARASHWSVTDGRYDARVTTYVYRNTAGTPVGCVFRFDFSDGRRKQIRRARHDGDAWINEDMLPPKPLYLADHVAAAEPDQLMLVAEGEKCVDALVELMLNATCSSGGAHAPLADTDWSPLKGRHVIILPDHDKAGQRYGVAAAAQARAAGAARVAILEIPGLDYGGDVFDWIESRRTAGQKDAAIAAELDGMLPTAVEVTHAGAGTQEGSDADAQPDAATDGPDHEHGYRLGHPDPASGRLVISPRRTLPTALAFLREHYEHLGQSTLLDYAGCLWAWRGNRYGEVEEGHLQQQLFPWLHAAMRPIKDRESGDIVLADFEANPGTVCGALKSVRATTHLPASTPTPSWLGSGEPPFPIRELLPCKSMTVHIPTGNIIAPTPALFAFNALDYDYDGTAADPVRWIAFLEQIFEADTESLNLLQEWLGYCLTGDTTQQKMLLLVGPRRSGKGTIARVMTRLVGAGNVVGPTVGSLGGAFGLQPLLGKSLAIVSDARFAGDNVSTVVERLLCISGEDSISVDRKFLGAVTLKLPTRFVFLTNELPRFTDASTALAGRFLVIKLRKSFYGTEDLGLTDALLAEIPGILLWALLGLHRLRERGRFVEPTSSRAAINDIEDLSSPVRAFVRDRCVIEAGRRVSAATLYAAWQNWCLSDGRNTPTTKQVFGRDLQAAYPSVDRRRGTGLEPFYDGIGLNQGETP